MPGHFIYSHCGSDSLYRVKGKVCEKQINEMLPYTPLNSSFENFHREYCYQDIVLTKSEADLFRRLIHRLVREYHNYAGLTLGPPRILRESNNSGNNSMIAYKSRFNRVTPKSVELFKSMFLTNTKIPNIASIDMEYENYLDYVLLVREYLPRNGVIVYSNDKNVFRKIYDPYFFRNCNLTKDDMGYRFTYDTSIKVLNGYNKKHKEIKYKKFRIVDLKLYILIDPLTKKAKFYRIENITKPNIIINQDSINIKN